MMISKTPDIFRKIGGDRHQNAIIPTENRTSVRGKVR
jgi:prephenate dehydratase